MTALSLDRSTLDMRRGVCPALSTPMMTGDGLLARISLVEAISPVELANICRLALMHGNGMIDISARGNLQIRGLSETSAPRLDADVRAMNLALRDGLAVEVPPLAGMDESEIVDPRPIAEAIRKGAREITGLAPKMAVVIDGAGQLRLSDLLADIRLVAVSKTEWKLLLGGTEQSGRVINVLRETHAVDTVLALLRRLAALGNKARGRDLSFGPTLDKEATAFSTSSSGFSRGSAGVAPVDPLRMLGTSPSMTAQDAATAPSSPFNFYPLADSLHAIGIGPAFGQSRAKDLIALCDEASRLGIRSLKPALDHALLFFGPKNACEALQDFACENGFITSASDPRGHIAACTGSPACNSATVATHDIAAEAAAECGDLLDGSFKLHVTGCAKGCAHPEPTALALCGTAAGVSLIAQGKASGEPFAFTDFADTNATLRRLSDLVRIERRPGENSADCLARIGSARLAAAATGRP
ncbi:precorrin-3B synthase [Aliirhizobium terrae]|uniref:precorrin-3B synthase n=1 Tax=Terrirhizobium terrae TaxID=2926709 RepID=UPI00257555AD|nr:precorrin-3B synthase [Rhizobium sp. CC-CFT758]WJH41560.1 precorrin-3B synthase [Rhizobium sp. CC-CFT758]